MRRLLLSLTAPAAIALIVAGCGGGSGSTGGYGGGSTAPAKATVTTRPSPLGTVLVDGKGRTVYLFEKDQGDRSACNGACASLWPPVPAGAAGSGIDAARLGTISRDDGTREATYAGHPLYYYAGDQKPGQAKGQGLDQFGAEWYVLSPAGHKIDEDD